jgi:hypothetical protein
MDEIDEQELKTKIHTELINAGFHNYYGDQRDKYFEFLDKVTKVKMQNPDTSVQLIVNAEYLKLLKDTNRPNINVYEDDTYW